MLIKIIDFSFQIYLILLFVRILSSWVPESRKFRAIQFVNFYTDPYLDLFRKFIPPIGMIDISPIVAIFCLGFIENFVKFVAASLFL